MDRDAAKKAAGEAAATLVQDGMDLGLGTGSTAACALDAIGRRVREEDLDVRGVPTSFGAERRARAHGIPLTTLDEVSTLDLAVDGADEVNEGLQLIKGGGGAHSREKVVATQAERFVVLVDPTKQVSQLGEQMPVPVEVLPMAVAPVRQALEDLGARPELRMSTEKDGPVVTDQGLWLLDAYFPDGVTDPEALNRTLCRRPGVLDHGLFLHEATDLFVGHPEGTVDRISA
ncbi:ribose 5-phosphate isomerase A [Salinibacter sp. 10B]|uniref:ribose-5-phosphate isomerase RpiA n=1 Tax=Salinibacter sp. 10B TaxID=1923971 RepID=UPI000CF50191|nr:ribose-5-phosphate isomerase RpiA [Salinibacter sp. 10B]PQJ35570.1 ribose 5-phosphate isomerase A [Salinibacter sp. 10B]